MKKLRVHELMGKYGIRSERITISNNHLELLTIIINLISDRGSGKKASIDQGNIATGQQGSKGAPTDH